MIVTDIPFLILWLILIIAGYFAATWFPALNFLSWPWYVTLFFAINLATFAIYGLDKLLAASGTRRVPERTLHLTAFLFGSPGALLAMNVFHHKTRKTSFQLGLALLVLVQVLVVFSLLYYVDKLSF